jgi:hypothetical protein
MLQQSISPLQLYKSPTLPAGLTESAHLSRAFMTKPHQIESMLMLGLGLKKGRMLQLLTGGLGNTVVVDNSTYRWGITTNGNRTIFVKGSFADGGGSGTPGIDGQTFRIILEENAFGQGDVLLSDSGTQVRVQGESYPDEGGHVFTVKIVGDNASAYIDPIDIAVGARFSKLYSAYEEFSIKGNSEPTSGPFMLENHLTILRATHEITRSAATDYLIMDFANPEQPNQKFRLWTRFAEEKIMLDFTKQRDYHMVYGKYSKETIKGENGRVVKIGAGLYDQIAPTNVHYTNKITYDLLDEILYQLSFNSGLEGGDQKFTILAGREAMKQFSDAITERFKTLNGIIATGSGQFISGTGNQLTFQGDQFVTANFPGGISATVVHFPLFDDPYLQRAEDPITGKLISSYEMIIMNTTGTDGKSNLRRVVKRGSDNGMWYIPGSIDPTKPGIHQSFNTMGATGKDGYAIHTLVEEGLMVQNPLGVARITRATAY